MEGEGDKRLNINYGDSDFVVSRKKWFSFAFFHWFFLLFDFIALLLLIHHCPIYCLMMTICDMMRICSHYC